MIGRRLSGLWPSLLVVANMWHELIASNPDDQALLHRIAARDPAAFERLFDANSALVLGVLLRVLGDRGEAEEVLQDVFLEAWRDAAKFRAERGSARTWLVLIARSRALDRLRSRSSRRRREERQAELVPQAASSDLAEWRIDVRRALLQLPEEQRQCVMLSLYGGHSLSQIAARLDAPIGTVKSRFLYGMRKLRSALGADPAGTSA